jgi:type 1 glutamine amidotransferase
VHRQALTDFIEKKGRGFVGTHSATDTYDSGWPWYTDFIGANFSKHSNAGTPGTARWAVGVTHAILTAAGVPDPWNRSEEWYVFTRDPLSSAIPGITILLTCTDTSNQFGERPSAWVHETPGGGRMFYTAFGHSVDAFQEPQVMNMLMAAIQWAAHRL